MSLPFRVFRQMLCFLLSILSALSLFLAIYLSRYFIHTGVAWMLITVEILCCIRSLWSALRKPWISSPQSVASEAVGLLIFFPFQLILTLLLPSIRLRPSVPGVMLTVLRALAASGAIIHMAYTIALVAIAMLTVPAFDVDIWLRDIDSSPSPFPLAIIFGYTFPRIARHFEATRPFARERVQPVEPPPTECLPECPPNCIAHGARRPAMRKSIDANTNTETPVPSTTTPHTEETKRPPVLPHTLIRIPNAAERRSSIYVELGIGR